MESLQNELVTLKTTLDAMAVINANLKNSIDVLTLKLEELQDNNDPKIEVSELAALIERRIDFLAPSEISFSWSDGHFSAEYEVSFIDLVEDELGSHWAENVAEFICEQIYNSRK